MPKKFPSPLLCLLCLLWPVFGGCAKRESSVARGNREGILHLSVGSEPTDLDPHVSTGLGDAKIVAALFDPLVTFEPVTLAPKPALAEHWEVSADGLTYKFRLRADAKWSNGEPLLAQDVVDSWRRALTASLGAEYAQWFYLLRGGEAYHKGRTADFSTVGLAVPEPRTVVVTLEHPAPYFLQILLNSPWRPVNVRAIAKSGDAYRRGTGWTKPGTIVTSGPFVLKEWSPHHRIVVAKNPDYWDRATVKLNGVVFYPTDSIDAEERAFRAGQLHSTWSLPPAKVVPLQREKSPALRLDQNLETHFLRFNVRKKPLDDPRIRRALALAIDRRTLTEKVLPGGRQPASTFVPHFLPGYTPPTREAYDPAAARRLLAEAGFPDGKGLPLIEILYNNSEILRLVTEALQQMWRRELGVDVRLVNQEFKVVFANRRAGDYQILLGSWTADYQDATTFLDMWRTDNGNNYTGWSDPAYDALLDRATRIADPVARAAVLAQAEALVLDAAPIAPVYFNTFVYLLHPAVQGWQPTPMNHTDYRYVSLRP